MRSQNATSNGRGRRRYRPYMFTEQGIAMLSVVLEVNMKFIQIQQGKYEKLNTTLYYCDKALMKKGNEYVFQR